MKCDFDDDPSVMEATVETIKSPIRKRKLIKKEEEDKVTLPDPFPLPQHFPTDVERALKTQSGRANFNAMVLSAMLL